MSNICNDTYIYHLNGQLSGLGPIWWQSSLCQTVHAIVAIVALVSILIVASFVLGRLLLYRPFELTMILILSQNATTWVVIENFIVNNVAKSTPLLPFPSLKPTWQ